MKTVRITALRQTTYSDLMEKYENPLETPCEMQVGEVFYSFDAQMPADFCLSAWNTLQPFVRQLAEGRGPVFDGWMKNAGSALLSCNDGFRPMSFLIETADEVSK